MNTPQPTPAPAGQQPPANNPVLSAIQTLAAFAASLTQKNDPMGAKIMEWLKAFPMSQAPAGGQPPASRPPIQPPQPMNRPVGSVPRL